MRERESELRAAACESNRSYHLEGHQLVVFQTVSFAFTFLKGRELAKFLSFSVSNSLTKCPVW